MKKNLLSIVVIVFAGAIIFFNLWKPSITESTKKNVKEDIPVDENVPGIDLTKVQEGNPAPDFELNTLSGKTIKLSDYKGKKVILNFWATWCPPCKAEMPHMQNFYEKNKDNGIAIVAVNLTNIDKGQTEIENFVKDYGLTFDILLDMDGTIGGQYQAFTIPTSYILDSKGIITKKVVGPMDEDMMMSLINQIN